MKDHCSTCGQSLANAQLVAWGEAIKERRQQFGFSGQGLAEAVGVHPSTVSRWERAQSEPSREHKLALARVLRRRAAALFAYGETP